MSLGSRLLLCSALLGAAAAVSFTAGAERASSSATDSKDSTAATESETPRFLRDAKQLTQGSATLMGRTINYQAEAGVIVVHLKDPMDEEPPLPKDERAGAPVRQPPEASMSYVAYFKGDKEDTHRPITFLFNGGPGSSTTITASST